MLIRSRIEPHGGSEEEWFWLFQLFSKLETTLIAKSVYRFYWVVHKNCYWGGGVNFDWREQFGEGSLLEVFL